MGLPTKKGAAAVWNAHVGEDGDVHLGQKAAGEVLERLMTAYHDDEADDARYDPAFRAQARRDNEEYEEKKSALDIALTRRKAGAFTEAQWEKFEQQVAAGQWRVGSCPAAQLSRLRARWAEFMASPVRYVEVLRACAAASGGTAASPGDAIAPEILQHGGESMYRLLHIVFREVHAGAAPPEEWGVGYVKWLWKGKKSKLHWRSYRGIVLVSTIGKAFERVLLRRLQLWAGAMRAVSHLQAVANGPLDARHQIQLLYDVALQRKTAGLRTVMGFADIGGAYPRTSRDILWRCLRDKGIVGGMLQSLQRLFADNTVRLGIAPGCFTRPVTRATGVAEGRVLSPLLFVLVADTLVAELQRAGGVQFAEQWVGAIMFMDDVVLLAEDDAQFRSMYNALRSWCFRYRYDLEMSKLHVLTVEPAGGGRVGESLEWDWVATDAAGVALGQAPVRVGVTFEERAVYLGVTIDHTLSWAPHVRAATVRGARLAGEIAQIRRRAGGLLSRQTLGMAWTCYARSYVEWSCAAWGFVPKAQLLQLEVMQMRALRAAVGAGDASHLPNAALRELFDVPLLRERRMALRA